MQLSLLPFQQIVSNSAAAVQASCAKLLNLTPGSVLRAVLEASASVGLWVQYLIVQVWAGCRLATSTGTDVDSFVTDFAMTRLAAVASSGQVTFTRFSSSLTAQITPYFNSDGSVNTAGVRVMTTDLSQTFGVVADITHTFWNATLGAYLIPAGTAAVTLTARAITAGLAGNVQAGTISLLGTATAGIDTVNNAAPFQNGEDPETDTAVRFRFANYINTRSRATPAAVEYAITTTQPGLSYSLTENSDVSGNYHPGNFVVVLDDGSGAPPASLITAVYSAVDGVRPIGSTFSVLAATVITVNVSMTIAMSPQGSKAVAQAEVKQAILDYIDGLAVGSPLPFSKVAQLAYTADANITNVTAIALNGGTADIPATLSQVIKAGFVTIN